MDAIAFAGLDGHEPSSSIAEARFVADRVDPAWGTDTDHSRQRCENWKGGACSSGLLVVSRTGLRILPVSVHTTFNLSPLWSHPFPMGKNLCCKFHWSEWVHLRAGWTRHQNHHFLWLPRSGFRGNLHEPLQAR